MAISAALRNCLRRANFSAISDIRFPPRLRETHNTAIVERLTATNNVGALLLVPARAQNLLWLQAFTLKSRRLSHAGGSINQALPRTVACRRIVLMRSIVREATRGNRVQVLPNLDSEPRTRAAVFHRRQRKLRQDHAFGEAILFPSCSFSTRGLLAFVGSIAGDVTALVAACALAASPVLAAEPGKAFVSAPPASMAASANTELGKLLNSGPEFAVAGERLNVELLRRFYARHGFEPVWTSRPAQASSLTSAVLRAGDQGLAPELFHANLLLSPTLPPLYRDLVLSDAFLSYADALARGIMPVDLRRDDEVLTPEPIDVAGALDAAIGTPDPAAAIQTLAPTTPTYQLLRQALQTAGSGIPSGGGRIASSRVRAIEVNLERERWLPRHLPSDRVWVNVADEQLVLYRNDQPVLSTKVIVGQDELRNQSPEFQVAISGVLFNPPWNIPPDITTNEILPKADHDPNYLAQHNMVMLPNGILQQVAGPNSGLGQLMFLMQNRFDVYLHDTPQKNLFARSDRRISHGCIRVEKPRDLAALLMQEPIEDINQTIATGNTINSNLPQPVQAFVVYETAFADADGRLQFRPDVYGRDAEIWQHLDPEQRALAERAAPGQRGG
jgi:L,D-transpeptidase YcbB